MYKCWKRLHKCKIESSIVCHLKLGGLNPHTGESSRKTKETAHHDVLGEEVLPPKLR